MNYQDMYGCTFEAENSGRGSNFEFRFSGPESIPNAVRRYNASRGAELAQLKRQREVGRSHVPSMPRFCKVRRPGQDVTSMVTSRDLDVVTQLSLCNEDNDSSSDDMMMMMGSPQSPRLCGGAESPRHLKGRKKNPPQAKTRRRRRRMSRHVEAVHSGHTFERLEELHREVCAELESLGQRSASPEVTPRAQVARRSTRRQQVSYEDYHSPQPRWADIMPSAMMSQAIQVNVCHAPDATPLSAYQFMEQHGSLEPEPLTPFFLEDSDLEHEYADRQGYLRYVEPRPLQCSSSESRRSVDRDRDQPCFVELERRPHQVSLLRSLSPMRYTSQRSEGQEAEEEVPPKPVQKSGKSRRIKVNQVNPKIRRLIAGGGGDELVTPKVTPNQPRRGRKAKPLIVYSKSLEDLKFEKLGIYNKITLTQERIIGGLDKLQSSLLQLQVPHCSAQERQRRQRNAFEFCVRFSRNFLYPLKGMIDDVRFTTVASFNSATSNEACQRVVCVYGLMQQSIQTFQRQLRYFLLEKVPQKLSALIEMIYTLTNCCLEKGMLDRQDPVVECLQERCTRFLSFIEDMQEERFKLAREEMRRQGRKGTVSHPQKKLKKKINHPKARPKAPTQPRQEKMRCHERYDLKMCLNDHKLYEPRLVPKERSQANPRMRRPRNTQGGGGGAATSQGLPTNPPTELPGDLERQSAGGDDMQTQIQMAETSSLSLLPTSVQHQGHHKRGRGHQGDEQLHRALLDALQLVSRSQVEQVLDPLIQSLNVFLGDKH
ncbi:uncharacterized protein [Drosophila takahashii]|uniref:uncharacterized protein n=1 Tax=Drosophila takahashii TaxID=29030 RepID=UPI001CF8BCDC|nr:uncharacterized protein LOC108069512 [Drosophila takahashii]